MNHIPTINTTATGERIYRMIHDVGMSTRDMSDAIGLTGPQAIYKWFHGKSLPSIDNLVAIAAVLGVTIDDLIVTE